MERFSLPKLREYDYVLFSIFHFRFQLQFISIFLPTYLMLRSTIALAGLNSNGKDICICNLSREKMGVRNESWSSDAI
jgi:hypothetical protein